MRIFPSLLVFMIATGGSVHAADPVVINFKNDTDLIVNLFYIDEVDNEIPGGRILQGESQEVKTKAGTEWLVRSGEAFLRDFKAADEPEQEVVIELKAPARGFLDKGVDPLFRAGGIRKDTTPDQVLKWFGEDNVEKADIETQFEGETKPGFRIFGGTEDQIEIVWKEDGSGPALLYFRGVNWTTAHDIGFNVSPKLVSIENEKEYTLGEPGTKEENIVTSWNGGELPKELGVKFEFPKDDGSIVKPRPCVILMWVDWR
ncbi:MAG: hypothetical protein AAF585_05565 [Verrucomicrobiota bacterium]